MATRPIWRAERAVIANHPLAKRPALPRWKDEASIARYRIVCRLRREWIAQLLRDGWRTAVVAEALGIGSNCVTSMARRAGFSQCEHRRTLKEQAAQARQTKAQPNIQDAQAHT